MYFARHLKRCLITLFITNIRVLSLKSAQAELVLKLWTLDEPVTSDQARGSNAKASRHVTISLGEPLSVRLELVNSGADSVAVFPSLDPAAGCVSFHVAQPQQKTMRITTIRWEVRDVYQRQRVLQPGERLIYETFLFGKLKTDFQLEYLFEEQGTYQLFARYDCGPEGAVESEPVTVVVGAPIQRWKDLREAGIIEHIEGRSRSAEQRETRDAKLRAILKQLPANPYQAWFSREKSVTERTAQEEQLAQAQKTFENSGGRPKIEAVVRRFLTAHTAGRIEECEQMMTDDFLRGGSMNRQQALAKMKKEFEKRKGGVLEAEPTIDSVTTDGTDVVVRVTVTYRYQGQTATQKESYTLRQENNQWKVRRMEIIESPPSPVPSR